MIKRNLLTTGIFITISLACFAGCANTSKKSDASETMATVENSAPSSVPTAKSDMIDEAKEDATPTPDKSEQEKDAIKTDAEQPDSEMDKVTVAAREDITESANAEDIEQAKDSIKIEELEDVTMYATADVNLRKENTTASEVLRVVAFGENIIVTGITSDGKWYFTQDSPTGEGFISSAYLSETKPEAKHTEESQTQQQSSPKNLKMLNEMSQEELDSLSQEELSEAFLRQLDALGYNTENPNRWKDLPHQEYHGGMGTGLLHAE